MSKKKKSYIWFIILLLVIIVLFVIISKQDISQQQEKKEALETKVLEIDKEKKSEGEITKESLENLMNQLKANLETPDE